MNVNLKEMGMMNTTMQMLMGMEPFAIPVITRPFSFIFKALRGFVWVVLGRGGAFCAIRAGPEWALRGFAKPLCEGA